MKKAQVVERKINAMLVKVELCKSMTQRITASIGGERVSHTRNVTANEDAVIRLAEAHDKLEQLNLEYEQAVEEITEVISQIESAEQQTILLDYYLKHCDFDQIADKMGVGRTMVYDNHKAALIEVEKVLTSDSWQTNSETIC